MRILIVDTAYYGFLDAFYTRRPELADASYDELNAAIRSEFFGICGSYANHLGRLGHETAAICVNDEVAQLRWAREHPTSRLRVLGAASSLARSSVRPLGAAARRALRDRPTVLEEVFMAQVRAFAPELMICLDVVAVAPGLLSQIRSLNGCTLVGQHAASPFDIECLREYDVFVSSVPPVVSAVRKAGLPAQYLRLGFDPEVLDAVPDRELAHDISFVGSLFPGLHDSRVPFLERMCERFPGMRIWSGSVDQLPPGSPIRDRYAGQAWGADMYRVVRASRLTLNRHDDMFDSANNCRLFEATGCGTALVTDARSNLQELFDVGGEVLAYDDVDHCIELVERYLGDEQGRATIARAGQERTLREHTYERRMEELLELVGALHRPHTRTRHSATGG